MLGIAIGAFVLFGAAKIARRAMWMRRGRFGGGHFAMACGGGGRGGSWSRHGRSAWDDGGDWNDGGGEGFFLRELFIRLEATPAQEKAIWNAFGQLRSKARALRKDAQGARSELASAFRGETLDVEMLGATAHRASDAIDSLRDAMIGALLEVHGTLDERQRKVVAEVIERGPRAFRRSRDRGSFRAWAEA